MAPSLSPVPHHVRVFAVCAFGFVLLGIGTSLFGVAWPSVADEMDRSIGELGYVTLVYGFGYTVASLVSGRLSARSSVGTLLLTAATTAATALALLAASPAWIIFLSAAAILGAASGQIDSELMPTLQCVTALVPWDSFTEHLASAPSSDHS